MGELVLKPGGRLEFRTQEFDDQTDEPNPVSFDVTADAVAYLMDAVRFEGRVCLRDIFALLECNPSLLQIFRRLYAEEYLREAKTRPASPCSGEYEAEGIEYLELEPGWQMDSHAGELVVAVDHRLSIAAVGHVLRQDTEIDSGMFYKAGTRIRWSISGCQLPDLMNLPLRLEEKVSFSKTHGSNKSGRKKGLNSLVLTPSLFQIIDAPLWELSFFGGPEQTAAFAVELGNAMSDRENWTELDPEDLLGNQEAGK